MERILATVVKDQCGSLDVIIYEHGKYSKPILILSYEQFKLLNKEVEENNLLTKQKKEKF